MSFFCVYSVCVCDLQMFLNYTLVRSAAARVTLFLSAESVCVRVWPCLFLCACIGAIENV